MEENVGVRKQRVRKSPETSGGLISQTKGWQQANEGRSSSSRLRRGGTSDRYSRENCRTRTTLPPDARIWVVEKSPCVYIQLVDSINRALVRANYRCSHRLRHAASLTMQSTA